MGRPESNHLHGDPDVMKTPVALVVAALIAAILLAASLLIATGTRGSDWSSLSDGVPVARVIDAAPVARLRCVVASVPQCFSEDPGSIVFDSNNRKSRRG
jgi:hypothetical protein